MQVFSHSFSQKSPSKLRWVCEEMKNMVSQPLEKTLIASTDLFSKCLWIDIYNKRVIFASAQMVMLAFLLSSKHSFS